MASVRDPLILVVVLVATLVAALGHARLVVDVENGAMKSVGTPQAEIAARAEREFGVDRTVVLLLEPRGASRVSGDLSRDARAWIGKLRALPGVARVRDLPVPGLAGAVVAAVDVRVGGDGLYADAVRETIRAAERLVPLTHRVFVSGGPVAEIAIAEAMVAEQARIVPTIVLALAALLLLCYRRVVLAAGVLLPALAAILLLGGIRYVLGLTVDPVAALLDPVVLTIGVAGAVHLVEAFLGRRERGLDVDAAVRTAVRDLRVPASLTVATTIAGFVGLLVSPVPAVGRFGVLAAAGAVVAVGVTFVVLPPWLRLFARSDRMLRRGTRRNPWPFFGAGLATGVKARARAVVGVAALGLLVFAGAWSRLRVDTDPIRVMPDDHPFRVATRHIGERLGGVDTFDLLLGEPQPAFAPARLAALQMRLAGLDGIVMPTGPARHGGDGSYLVSSLLAPGGTTRREATFAAAESVAAELGWKDAHATGPAVLVARDSGAMVRGQLEGLAFTVLFLWLAMAVGFRSWSVATLGLLPNVLPCVLLYGSLAFADHPLSVGTAMIGSVMLGVVVDDTIHFLHGYHHARRRGCGRTSAIARAFRRSGRAIVVTSAVLALGFAAGLLGELETTREFGLLAGATILVALAADLLVLPAAVLFREAAAPRSPA